MDFKNNIFSFFNIIKPEGKKEYYLFFICFLFYYSIGIYLSMKTNIIDLPYRYNMYFNFDNGAALYKGSDPNVAETHPLTLIFYLPMIVLRKTIFFLNISLKIYTLFIVSLCSFFVSYSNLFVFKYLKNIINLEVKLSMTLVVLYVFFSGNIILSFTPETFTFSLFLLTSFTYITSFYIKKGRNINLVYYIASGILVGGQTITNAPKILIPILFEKNKEFKTKLRQIIVSILIISSVISIRFGFFKIITANLDRKNQYEDVSTSIGQAFISFFFGGNILFPSLRMQNNYSIEMNYYSYIAQISFVYCFILLIIFGFLRNIKNKLVWILALSFSVDLFYFFILRVALPQSFIYGGHFIFIIPLFIGWLFNSFKYKFQNIFKYLLYIFILILVINNGYRVLQFIYYAQILYPNN